MPVPAAVCLPRIMPFLKQSEEHLNVLSCNPFREGPLGFVVSPVDGKPLNVTQNFLTEGASGSPALNPQAIRNFPTEFHYSQLT